MPEVAIKCWACIVGLHEECIDPQITEDVDESSRQIDVWVTCCCGRVDASDDVKESTNGVGRPVLEPSDITDILSTGRKRAAMLYPIYDGMECEWAWLRNAGGGVYPIIGCAGNTIEQTKKGSHAGHRHHGPNKNTISNEQGNVHRICAQCHVRWHALNNKTYEGERPPTDQPWLPVAPEGMTVQKHDPETRATDEERAEADEYFSRNYAKSAIDIDD